MFVGFVLISLFGALSYTFCLVLFCLGDLVLVCSFATLWFDCLFGLVLSPVVMLVVWI